MVKTLQLIAAALVSINFFSFDRRSKTGARSLEIHSECFSSLSAEQAGIRNLKTYVFSKHNGFVCFVTFHPYPVIFSRSAKTFNEHFFS